MARPQTRLNDQKAEVIAENHLLQNPEGLDKIEPESEVVIANHIPAYRKVVFLNGRDPGLPLDFHYRTKTHPLKLYTLFHGQEHDLPEEVIEHLENCAVPVYGYRVNPLSGHPESYIKSRNYLYTLKTVRKTA